MIPVDPKPFKKIRTTLLWAIVLMLVCLGVYGYFFYTLNTTRNDVAMLTKQTVLLQQEASESSEIKNQVADTDARRSALVSYFVDAHNPVPFEETIERYGTETNTPVAFNGLEIKSDPNRLDVSFNVHGDFASMYKFFALLESAPYEFSINNVNMQLAVPIGFEPAGTGAHSKNDWQAMVSMSVYSISGVQ